MADDLEAAHEKRLAIHGRARAIGSSSCHPFPTFPHAALGADVEALAPIEIDGDHAARCRDVRKWDRAAGDARDGRRRRRNPVHATHSSSMLAALCQQVNAWRLAEKKATRARRALELAERVFDAYQEKQKEDLTELLKRISHRVAQIYSALHPGEDLDAVSVEPWTAQGRGAGDRVLRIASAAASRRAQRVAPELARDRALSGDGGKLQRADRIPRARRRDQQLRRRAPRPARRAAGRRVLRLAAHRAHARSAVLRAL